MLLKYYEEFKNLSIENVMKIISKIPYFLIINNNDYEENTSNYYKYYNYDYIDSNICEKEEKKTV